MYTDGEFGLPLLMGDEASDAAGRTVRLLSKLLRREGPDSPPKLLHHYTTAEGVIGILRSEELWATNVLYLNDSEEIEDGIRHFDLLRKDVWNRSTQIGRWVLAAVLAVLRDPPIRTFVTCFCEDGDLLGQWRGYAPFGGGYSIAIPSRTLLDQAHGASERGEPRFLQRVIYDEAEKNAILRRYARAFVSAVAPHADEFSFRRKSSKKFLLEASMFMAGMLIPRIAAFKNEKFAAEREWRLLAAGHSTTGANELRFRSRNGVVVPYVGLRMSASQAGRAFPTTQIRAGPFADPFLPVQGIRDMLGALQYRNVEVVRSAVPLRF